MVQPSNTKNRVSPTVFETKIRRWVDTLADGLLHVRVVDICPGRPLLPAEEVIAHRFVNKRLMEFAAGRHCARLALGEIGIEGIAIGRGARGEPLWPDGALGSISHDEDLAVAVVASANQIAAVGIDLVRLDHALDPASADLIAGKAEFDAIEAMLVSEGGCKSVDPILLAFSAKEAMIKLISPAIDFYLDFREIKINCTDRKLRLSYERSAKKHEVFWQRVNGTIVTLCFSKL